MQNTCDDWSSYPMGPNLRIWLGLETENESSKYRTRPDQTERVGFSDFLLENIQKGPDNTKLDEPQLVDLVDELVAMDLPFVALKLIDSCAVYWHRNHFRGVLAEGIAAMQVEDLERSERCFRLAQGLAPTEPAAYVNLVQIMISQDRLPEARTWCQAGLTAEPNNYNLWDLLAELAGREKAEFSHHDIISAAKEFHSWAGYSLAADLDPDANSQTKAGHLDAFYNHGERSGDFLIEYTGALGAAGHFDRIPQIIWQAEKLASESIPWKLHLHGAQAHLAMNQLDRFAAVIEILRRKSGVPAEVISELEQTYIEETKTDNGALPN
jgi:tetratricopeptide (TPR) repeat protein